LRGEPVLQFVERFHRQEDVRGNFDCVGFHRVNNSMLAARV
jgi:hypothetical protein